MQYVLVAIILLQCQSVTAQLNGKYTFRHIGTSDGLLYSIVKGIAQDEKGYMWFLTNAGLQRYDGHSFLNFPQILEITEGEFWSGLYADQKGSLIIWKGDKYIRFDLQSHQFVVLSPEELFQHEPPSPGIDYVEDGNHVHLDARLWTKYEKHTNKIITSALNYNLDLKHSTGWQVYDHTTGNFITFQKGLDLLIWNPLKKQQLSSASDTSTLPIFAAWNKVKVPGYDKMMIDSKRRVWFISYNHHLYRYDLNTEQMTHFSLQDIAAVQKKYNPNARAGLIHYMMEDDQQNIWLATEGLGLLLLDPDHDQFLSISSLEKIVHGLRYNYGILTMFQDRDGNIWLGTDRGINVFNPQTNYFQIIRHIESSEATLPQFDITDVIQTSTGEILVGTWDGGITIYDSAWNFIRNVRFDGVKQHNQIWCFMEQADGTIWAGCNWGYIHKYNPGAKTFSTERPPETMGSTILRMAKDSHGNIYLALRNGKVVYWSERDKRFYPFRDLNSAYRSYPKMLPNIFIDHADRCWFASDYCLLEFDAKQQHFTHAHCQSDAMRAYDIRTMAQFNDTTLLVGLRGNGMYLFNTQTHRISRPAIQSCFDHITISGIKSDSKGNYWFCAGSALYVSNPELSAISKINLGYNALTSDFYELGSFYELRDGRWVTSTPSEIISFDPRRIQQEENEKKVVLISGLTIMKTSINVDSLLATPAPVILPYHENFFTIEFTALEYLNAFDITYAYRLVGIDADWTSTSTQYAMYTDLRPGEYFFEVKAQYGSNESPVTSLAITITPPWWATWWFRTLCIAGLLSLAFFLLKRRIAAIRKEAELKHRMAETEMMALRSQMNPHFIFNCLASIDNLIQNNQREDATLYLAKFANLIRAILENSKSNVIPVWKDMEALQLYLDLEALRWDNKINYHIQIDPQIREGDYKIPPMVIQPFVENAIHHGLISKKGNDKHLVITADLQGENILFTIMDNGIGRRQAAIFKKVNRTSHTSYGIQITRDRIDYFNQQKHSSIHIEDLYDENQMPAGTRVEVRLSTHPASA